MPPSARSRSTRRRWPGTSGRLGSIERGKRANLVVTDGDLIGGTPKIKHLFVGGRLVAVQP